MNLKENRYTLTVLASDDGSCCGPPHPQGVHTSTVTVLLGVLDVK